MKNCKDLNNTHIKTIDDYSILLNMNRIKNYLFFLVLTLMIGCSQYLPNYKKNGNVEIKI